MVKILMLKKGEKFLTLSTFTPSHTENPFKQETCISPKEKLERPTCMKMAQAWNGLYPVTATK